MPSSGSFVTMYLAELHFGNGYMVIGLLISSLHGNTRGLQTAFTADYVLGISIYKHATVRLFGPLLDTSAIRGKNMKHSDYNKGTSPTTGDARPVYTTVNTTDLYNTVDAQSMQSRVLH